MPAVLTSASRTSTAPGFATPSDRSGGTVSPALTAAVGTVVNSWDWFDMFWDGWRWRWRRDDGVFSYYCKKVTCLFFLSDETAEHSAPLGPPLVAFNMCRFVRLVENKKVVKKKVESNLLE